MNSSKLLSGLCPSGCAVFCALICLQGCDFLGNSSRKSKVPVETADPEFHFRIDGSDLDLDSTYRATWNPDAVPGEGTVHIGLYQGDEFKIALGTFNAQIGEFAIDLASLPVLSGYTLGSGGGYRLKIAAAADSSNWEMSDTFSIHSAFTGTLQVSAPPAGSRVWFDSSLSILWESNGDIGPDLGVHLYKDSTLVDSIRSQVASEAGSYLWPRIVSTFGENRGYRIRIFSLRDPAISAFSGSFSMDSTGYVTLVSPASGASLKAGGLLPLVWVASADTTASGNLGPLAVIDVYRDSVFFKRIFNNYRFNEEHVEWRIPMAMPSDSTYRIRISSMSSEIGAFSGYFTIHGIDSDAFEPDDSKESAKVILTDGTAQTRTLLINDLDWLKMEVDTSKTYDIHFKSSRSATVTLDGVDQPYGASQPNSMTNSDFTLRFSPASNGWQFFHVGPLKNEFDAAGDYTLSVSSFLSLVPGMITYPTTGTEWAAGVRDTVRWIPDTAKFGDTIQLSLFHGATQLTNGADRIPNNGAYMFNLFGNLFTDSNYRLLLSGREQRTYSAYFSVQGIIPDSLEPNNTQESATALESGQSPLKGTIGYADEDWFKFNAKAQAVYLLQVTSTSPRFQANRMQISNRGVFSALAQIYKSRGPDSVNSLLWTCPATNSYSALVAVFAPDGHSTNNSYFGDYRLTLKELDPDSSAFMITFPAVNTLVHVGDTVSVQWTDPALIRGVVDITLYKENVLLLTIGAVKMNTGKFDWIVPSGLEMGSGYDIRVGIHDVSTVRGGSEIFSVGP